MRSRGSGEHGCGITRVSGVMRSEHPCGAVRELNGRQRLGVNSLVRREELREGVQVMREVGSVMRVRRVASVMGMIQRVRKSQLLVMMRVGRRRRWRLMPTTAGMMMRMMMVHRRHAGMVNTRRNSRKILPEGTAVLMMRRTGRRARGAKQGLRVEWTRKRVGKSGILRRIVGRSGGRVIGVVRRRRRRWRSTLARHRVGRSNRVGRVQVVEMLLHRVAVMRRRCCCRYVTT